MGTVKQLIKYIGIVTLVLQLVACGAAAHPPMPKQRTVIKGMVTGASGGAAVGAVAGVSLPLSAAAGGLAGGLIGYTLEQKNTITQQLANADVQLIRIGEDFMLVLPSDNFFYPDSNHLNEYYQPVLDTIARYIKPYDKEVIKVAGYTDNIGSPLRNVALSREQAQTIVKYLWTRDIHAPMMYGVGYGGLYPIASNRSSWGRKQNRRVQITFRTIDDKELS
ncbi:MAG: OmpA family protein [Gammaproteobacteria bacterium]